MEAIYEFHTGGWAGSDLPTLISATYDDSTGIVTFIGANPPDYSGSKNDIDICKFSFRFK